MLASLPGCNRNYNHTQKPAGGLCLSFDDRSIDQWFLLRGIFNENHAKVTFFITQFDSLTDDEIEKLRMLQKDGHEIGSHGARHVLSEYFLKDHSMNEYLDYEIIPSITSMRNHGFYPTAFAFPYGAMTRATNSELLKYFCVLRTDVPVNKQRDLSSMDDIYYAFDGSRVLSSVGIDYNYNLNTTMLEKAMKRASDNNEILMLHGHEPSEQKADYVFDVTLLKEIFRLARKYNLMYYTATETQFMPGR